MWFSKVLIVLAAAGSSLATCRSYGDVDWNKTPFSIRVHSESRSIDGLYMKLLPGGGGDKDLYFTRGGKDVAKDLFLEKGVITQISNGKVIRVVASGDYNPEDGTTKMFMTQRDDPPAKFAVSNSCNKETGKIQHFLCDAAVNGLDDPGKHGHTCVTPGHNGRLNLRYSPTPLNERECTEVKLELVITGPDPRLSEGVKNNHQ